jgi:hypothetical protein
LYELSAITESSWTYRFLKPEVPGFWPSNGLVEISFTGKLIVVAAKIFKGDVDKWSIAFL